MGSHFDQNSTKLVSDSDPVGLLLGDLLGDRLVIDWVFFVVGGRLVFLRAILSVSVWRSVD